MTRAVQKIKIGRYNEKGLGFYFKLGGGDRPPITMASKWHKLMGNTAVTSVSWRLGSIPIQPNAREREKEGERDRERGREREREGERGREREKCASDGKWECYF